MEAQEVGTSVPGPDGGGMGGGGGGDKAQVRPSLWLPYFFLPLRLAAVRLRGAL